MKVRFLPLSQIHADTDQYGSGKLGKYVEEKIADDQHVECGIVTKYQILFDGNKMADAHNDHGYKDQGKCPARSEEYG